MSRQRKARPRAKRYLQRPVSLPMTGAKRNEIALHMHAAFTGVAAGGLDSFDALANIINIAQLVMVNDDRFTREFRLANGAAMALIDIGRLIEGGVRPKEHHLAPVRVAVAAIDAVLPRMDMARLYVAQQLAVATLREQRAAVAAIQEKKHGTGTTADQPVDG